MTGIIEQISVSPGGLPKHAISEAWTSRLGLAGDRHKYPQIHGGPRKAVLLVSAEDLDELSLQGFPVQPGSLGENLTVRGLNFRRLKTGQTFSAGQAILELTQIRQPCQQLEPLNAGREGLIQSVIQATHALGGFYAAVVQEGLIRTGDSIAFARQRP